MVHSCVQLNSYLLAKKDASLLPGIKTTLIKQGLPNWAMAVQKLGNSEAKSKARVEREVTPRFIECWPALLLDVSSLPSILYVYRITTCRIPRLHQLSILK